MSVIRSEAATVAAIVAFLIFTIFGNDLAPDLIGLVPSNLLLALLSLVMLWAAFSVVRHAE